MTERYRAENERSTWMRFHTQTAGVSLTPQQPLNNLTRVAIQALAAVLGGTQSLHTDAYDEALAVPTAEAALLALRQQQIIAEETGVANTVDPLGGSWFVEALTNETERAGLALPRRDRPARRHGRGDRRRATRSARSPTRPIASSASSTPASGGSSGVNAYVDEAEETTIPVLAGARRVARSAISPGSSGRAASATRRRSRRRSRACARRRSPAGLVRDEPDAPLHPLRRGLRDARRAVRRPARGLRRVPRAGRGLADRRLPRRSGAPAHGLRARCTLDALASFPATTTQACISTRSRCSTTARRRAFERLTS